MPPSFTRTLSARAAVTTLSATRGCLCRVPLPHGLITRMHLRHASNSTETDKVDYEVDHLVIGAGVVGLAIAEKLSARRSASVLLVDKNPAVGQETR